MAVSQSWWFNRTNAFYRTGNFQPYIYTVFEPTVLCGDKHAGWQTHAHKHRQSPNQCRVPLLLVHERNWLLANSRNPRSEPHTRQNTSSSALKTAKELWNLGLTQSLIPGCNNIKPSVKGTNYFVALKASPWFLNKVFLPSIAQILLITVLVIIPAKWR